MLTESENADLDSIYLVYYSDWDDKVEIKTKDGYWQETGQRIVGVVALQVLLTWLNPWMGLFWLFSVLILTFLAIYPKFKEGRANAEEYLRKMQEK